MKSSNFLISTYKEAPADAEITSHQLMVRAGLIKKLSSGIYTYMPMGLRVIKKIERIVREEMNKAGAIELSMPVVQPAELWQETNRFSDMGDELLRIKDRHNRDFVIQPTSEEVVTDIARQEINSYKQLPINLYQIQTKFRDERRPRFGLMRGREFIMKDAYSFDKSEEDAKISYQLMAKTYRKIFDRFGLKYRAVAADSGAIGGDLSEEFQVIAATGEDAIVFCPDSQYAANIEKATALKPTQTTPPAQQSLTKTATPSASTCQQVATLLNIDLQQTVKSIVLATDEVDKDGNIIHSKIWLLLLRGDHGMNEIKVNKIAQLEKFRFASIEEIQQNFGCVPGYLGPINISDKVKIIADEEVMVMADWVCGANEEGFHYTGVNWQRDLAKPFLVQDIRNIVAGDLSPDGKGILAIERGIEIGHVFYLGTKYSKPMKASFLDKDGKSQFFEMGCYGLGISRLPAAAIEQNYDEKGIIWPDALAPFTIVICPIGYKKSDLVTETTDLIYQQLVDLGVDVILDDRGERPGVMFNDWDLIGIPHRLIVSERGLQNKQIEYKSRKSEAAQQLDSEKIVDCVKNILKL